MEGLEPESRQDEVTAVFRVARRLAESSIAAGAASEVEAFQDHLTRMLEMENAKILHQVGRTGSHGLSIHRDYVAEVQVWRDETRESE